MMLNALVRLIFVTIRKKTVGLKGLKRN